MKVLRLSQCFSSRSPTMLEMYERCAGEHLSDIAVKAREYREHEAQFSCAVSSTHVGGQSSRAAWF